MCYYSNKHSSTTASQQLFSSHAHIGVMFAEVTLNPTHYLLSYSLLKHSFSTAFLCFFITVNLLCASHFASGLTLNYLSSLSSSSQFELMSNSSYRNFMLRQYFIDVLNISHTSLIRSMNYSDHVTGRSLPMKSVRRKRQIGDTASYSPVSTLHSSACVMNNKQAQSTFIWSYFSESLASVELVYHIDSSETKRLVLPIQIKFQHSQSSMAYLTINTYLQFDFNRDFYFTNIYQNLRDISNESLIIQSTVANETCQKLNNYMIISSENIRLKSSQTSKVNPTVAMNTRQSKQTQVDSLSSSSSSTCKLKTVQIKFEDLGLAYLIIRPKEYKFTYCDGSCSYATLQQHLQTSIHALLQSIINRKKSSVPQPSCAPSQYADETFLLRQTDGTLEIYPIKDVVVKQCACL